MYIDERFKSPEKKSLAEARNHIKKTIIMIYNQCTIARAVSFVSNSETLSFLAAVGANSDLYSRRLLSIEPSSAR
jgi:CRISPR/Cas system CMR-associated protein Cmr5 small subunit